MSKKKIEIGKEYPVKKSILDAAKSFQSDQQAAEIGMHILARRGKAAGEMLFQIIRDSHPELEDFEIVFNSTSGTARPICKRRKQ